MPFVGSISASPLDPRDRPAERARERRRAASPGDAFQRAMDEADLSSVDHVDAAEGLRSVKANEDEESHEDRTEHGYYTQQGGRLAGRAGGAEPERPKLDLKG